MPSQKQMDASILDVVVDIRNWIRAAAHKPVKDLIEEALPDEKSRAAYQMFDGTMSIEQVRAACRMSPNAVVALAARCVALGLMATGADKRRLRLFDLADFGLLAAARPSREKRHE
jgi:hypothetical protein